MSIRRRIWKKEGTVSTERRSLAGLAVARTLPKPASRGSWNYTASQAPHLGQRAPLQLELWGKSVGGGGA